MGGAGGMGMLGAKSDKKLEAKAAKSLEWMDNAFKMYSEGGKITVDEFKIIIHASGMRFLQRELDDYLKTELADAKYVEWPDVKSFIQGNANRPQAYLLTEWEKSPSGKDTPGVAYDTYAQLFLSFKLLLDSNGDAEKIETMSLQCVLSSCGEEIDQEEFDEFLKLIGPINKGPFPLAHFMKSYQEFSDKVGLFDGVPDEKDNAQTWVDRAKETFRVTKGGKH